MRLVYFGSGVFGLPTLQQLAAAHDIALIVTQPDRPAGRHRAMSPTPIGEFSAAGNYSTIKPQDVNDPKIVEQIHALGADTFVVIAFGQKLKPTLLNDQFAINLHASLLPKYRGAAPIQWAMIEGECETGVSVIALADRMDAGVVYARVATPIDPQETAGELHDRLARLGPNAVLEVLREKESGDLKPQPQDESLATRAPKLSKADGTACFAQPASRVRARIHGLTPWPGCTVKLEERTLKIIRVKVVDENTQHHSEEVGRVQADHSVACGAGAIQLVEVQPPGGKVMSIDAYRAGHRFAPGMRLQSL